MHVSLRYYCTHMLLVCVRCQKGYYCILVSRVDLLSQGFKGIKFNINANHLSLTKVNTTHVGLKLVKNREKNTFQAYISGFLCVWVLSKWQKLFYAFKSILFGCIGRHVSEGTIWKHLTQTKSIANMLDIRHMCTVIS